MVEAQRDDEYAPVKTAEGKHSPASARDALSSCARRWLAAAGARLPASGLAIELDQSVIDSQEDAVGQITRDAIVADPAIRIGPGVSE
jgi:hypothetical protein